MKGFSKLCTPARIYFAIAVIAAVFSLFYGATLMSEALKLFFAFVWTFLLSWLCDKGFVSISWFLVLLPYLLMLLSMMNIYHATEQQRQLMRAVKMQGAFGKEPFVQEGAITLSEVLNKAASPKEVQDKFFKAAESVADYLQTIDKNANDILATN